MTARIGRARSTSAASPPTKIVRVAFCAPSEPPDTGASTRAIPPAASRLAKSRVAPGAIVEQSMTSVPGRAAAATPAGPNRTSSTSRGIGDADEDDVAGRRDVGGVRRLDRAEPHELRGPPGGAVPDGQRVAGAGEVTGHRGAHRPETDEPDAFHDRPPHLRLLTRR